MENILINKYKDIFLLHSIQVKLLGFVKLIMEQVKINDFEVNKIGVKDIKGPKGKAKFVKRVFLDYNKTDFAIETDGDLIVKFPKQGDKPTISNDIKYSFAVENKKLTDKIGTELSERLLDLFVENSESIFGEEKTLEDISEWYRDPVSHNDEFPSLFNLGFYSGNIDKGDLALFKVDDEGKTKRIKRPNIMELLKSYTSIGIIFTMPYATVKDGTTEDYVIRPDIMLKAIKIVGEGGVQIVYTNPDDIDNSKVSYSQFKDAKNSPGAKRVFVNYNGQSSLGLHLEDVGLVYNTSGIETVYKDEAKGITGEPKYGVTVSLQGNLHDVFNGFDESAISFLTENADENLHKTYKVLQKKVSDAKTKADKEKALAKIAEKVKKLYKKQCYYSKKVREEIAKGSEPEFPPTLHIDFPKYDDKFSTKFLTKNDDGELVPFEGDVDEYVKANNSIKSMDIRVRHLWLKADSYSFTWVADNVVLEPSDKVKQVFKFDGDEDDDSEEEPDNDEETGTDNDGDEDGDNDDDGDEDGDEDGDGDGDEDEDGDDDEDNEEEDDN